MLARLAFRNIGRNLRRLRPVLLTLVLSFALMVVANAVLDRTQRAFSEAYVDRVSGDVTIGSASETAFTLFGSEALLVGEFLVTPTLTDPGELAEYLNSAPYVDDYVFVVTSAARVEVGSRRRNQFIFGADFTDYSRFFPEISFRSGGFPRTSYPSVLLQYDAYKHLFDTDDPDLYLGSALLLSSAQSNSFAIREVTLAGVYDYPVRDSLLSQVALVDADTARALNGYLYGVSHGAELSDTQLGLLEDDVDSLFGAPDEEPSAEAPPAEEQGSIFDDLDALFATPDSAAEVGSPIGLISTAWNFALVRASDEVSTRQLVSRLNGALDTRDTYVVNDWRASIGGNVMIVHYIRFAANAGILFVVLGALIITVNSIVLSVLERTKEIGTMRAMGATKAVVARLLGLETLVSVFGAAAIGVCLGTVGVLALNATGLEAGNQYIQILFGGRAVQGSLSWSLVFRHLVLALALGAASVIYPLTRTLRLTPIKALNP